MQIIGKVKNASFATLKDAITDRVRDSVPESMATEIVVKPVFPGNVSGHRAGLFTVDLPDHVAPHVVTSVIDSLRDDEAVEYAELPAAKHTM